MERVLEAEGLAVDRGGRTVLAGVTLALHPGEALRVAGPSGCGKSTLLLALARLLPRQGALRLRGRPAEALSAPEWRSRVALVPQEPVALAGTVLDNLRRPWQLRVRRKRPAPGRAELGQALGELLPGVPADRPATRLSGGELARLALLRALLPGPEVLLLDETDAMLDAEAAARMEMGVAAFLRRGGAVVRVGHRGLGHSDRCLELPPP